MKLSLDLRTTLTQTLTPQQIQYLKLLQMPVVQLEQQIRHEIEQNPMLEETSEEVYTHSEDYEANQPDDNFVNQEDYSQTEPYVNEFEGYEQPAASLIDDKGDPFEFYKLVWQDNDEAGSGAKKYAQQDEDSEPFQIKANTSFIEEMFEQFKLLHFTDEQILLGEQIIWNTDDDGYLRQDLNDIVLETNELINELNEKEETEILDNLSISNGNNHFDNPAREYAISPSLLKLIENEEIYDIKPDDDSKKLNPVTIEDAEIVLKHIQSLDPPGFASRTIQECLLAQCRVLQDPNPIQKLATQILEKTYDAFAMKHYNVIMKQFEINEKGLKDVLDFIRHLNPKPGQGEHSLGTSTIIPDFTIEREPDSDDLLITVNDGRLPTLQLSKLYEKMKKEAKFKHFNKDTREWIRTKYEDAKFLIQAVRQRKNTMLKVMTSIAKLQNDFFLNGTTALKPLIYKDISENTGLDISTVCRIVNGKYVQTEFGIFDLKYFFSESLPGEDGEGISTTVIKHIIKEIIESEPKGKPFSDDKITKELKKKGYNVARRTVAKYREQLKIPVARLRREL